MSAPGHVIVVGGGVTGLGAALSLAQRGARVTVLEGDATPLPQSPLEAFRSWDRRGAPQARHSHAFLARLHNSIRRETPELYADLLAHGAEPLRFTDLARETLEAPELLPEDEEITLLACRRITFEWVLRRHVEALPGVELRHGASVEGLLGGTAEGDAPPRITGVRARRAGGAREELPADLVVDASGRRSKLSRWLEALGRPPLREESEPCGIFYSSRFYRLRDGVEPPVMQGAIGADLGYMKYGIFPGDDRIFSVTLAASPDDPVLRSVLRPEAFEAAARALPAVAAWTDPAVSEPITRVHGMGKLRNTLRHFFEEGRPRALGVLPLGDSVVHTNPINGRGCTLAWIQARGLGEAWARHAGDPAALADAARRTLEREILPWYQAGLAQDRDAREVDALQREGRDPYRTQREDGTVDPKGWMRSLVRDGLVAGLREDIVLLRAFMRVFNLLEPPADLMKDPQLMQRVLAAHQRRDVRRREPLGPSRHEMVEHLGQAAA